MQEVYYSPGGGTAENVTGQWAVIKITKPEKAPAILAERGQAKRAEHCQNYDLTPAGYDEGKQVFNFDASLYSHSTVKEALISAQHGKCCFCERKIGAEGDVEHFRPKAGFRQGKRSRLGKPGYYWLAYEWTNLLLACPICNQRFKKNYFPLRDLATRAVNHHSDIRQEEPLFINPAEVDPTQYIGFRQEVAYPINGSEHAKATIEALGLNRPNLSEERRDYLEELYVLRDVMSLEKQLAVTDEGSALVEKARLRLQQAPLDSTKFTAMARAAADAKTGLLSQALQAHSVTAS